MVVVGGVVVVAGAVLHEANINANRPAAGRKKIRAFFTRAS